MKKLYTIVLLVASLLVMYNMIHMLQMGYSLPHLVSGIIWIVTVFYSYKLRKDV